MKKIITVSCEMNLDNISEEIKSEMDESEFASFVSKIAFNMDDQSGSNEACETIIKKLVSAFDWTDKEMNGDFKKELLSILS